MTALHVFRHPITTVRRSLPVGPPPCTALPASSGTLNAALQSTSSARWDSPAHLHGQTRATDAPVVDCSARTRTVQWLLIFVALAGDTVFPAGGGDPLSTGLHPRTICIGPEKYLFVGGESEHRARAYVLPLSPDRSCLRVLHALGAFHRKRSWPGNPECGSSR